MAQRDETIDLTTLQEVHRLLESTDFASADDLAGRTDPSQLGQLSEALATRSTSPATVLSGGADPLPKRR